MAKFTQVSKVRDFLRGNSFQIKAEALDSIDEIVGRMLESVIEGAIDEGIKSIGSDDVHRFFISKSKKRVDVLADEETPDRKGCPRCAGIQDKFIQHGRNIQELVSDEALIMYNNNQ